MINTTDIETNNTTDDTAKRHWEGIYTNKASDRVSWYQTEASTSMNLLVATGLERDAKIIDIGAGASVFVDDLLEQGYQHLTVLDISEKALQISQARLGVQASLVDWKIADIVESDFPEQYYDLWHDRAVFHFFTDENDQKKYLENVKKTVKKGGFAIISTFAEDGPVQCSGIDIQRYSVQELSSKFEAYQFVLKHDHKESHFTPLGNEQKFIFCVFQHL